MKEILRLQGELCAGVWFQFWYDPHGRLIDDLIFCLKISELKELKMSTDRPGKLHGFLTVLTLQIREIGTENLQEI